MSSSTASQVGVESSATVPPAPTAAPTGDNINVAIRSGFTTALNIARKTVDDIVKPSIKSFIETCNTNPRVAAVVATPALLAFLFTLAFLIFSTLTLVIWTVITVTFGIVFVVIGGLKSLLLKLTLVMITTIPLAAVGTGLLVCGNSIAQIIIKRIPTAISLGGVSPSAVDEVDWQKVAEATLRHLLQWSRYFMPLFHTVLETTTNVVQASYASLRTAAVLMHDAAARDAAASIPPPPPQNESAGNLASNSERPMESSAPVHGDDHELIIIEPVNISNSSVTGQSTPTLQHRAPFRHPGDTDEGN